MHSRFVKVAASRGSQAAVGSEAATLTFDELLASAEAFATWLRGNRCLVLLAIAGGPSFTAIQLGAISAGAVVAPISDKSSTRETQGVLSLVRPDVVVVQSLRAQAAVLDALSHAATILSLDPQDLGAQHSMHRVVVWSDRSRPPEGAVEGVTPQDLPERTCMVQFTSGSTSTPKGILLSEANLLANLDANREHLLGLAGSAAFCPVPQFHAMGNAVVLEHLFHGTTVQLSNQFIPADDLRRMQNAGCSSIAASPNYFKLLLRLKVLSTSRLPQLRAFTIGTAAIDSELTDALLSAYPESVVHCRYGLSESVGALTRLELRSGESLRSGQLGPLVCGNEVSLLPVSESEPGTGGTEALGHELAVRGPCVGIGQLLARGDWRPLADEAGFLHTGDAGYLDERGHLHLTGRLSSFLKVNGHRISPFELEAALRGHPSVQEAVVVGPPDPAQGQRIVACVEPAPGHRIEDTARLLEHCRAELVPYKVPNAFRIYAQLPRTPAGKPDRKLLLQESTS
jgi:long-chain acyl-CoA synthetase